MAQKMTNNNKPYVMALFSGVAYKNPEDAKTTFDDYQFVNQKFIDMGGAQCYVVWNDDDVVIIFRGTEPNQWSDVKADLKTFKSTSMYKDGFVHGGFKDEVDKVWDEIDTTISVMEDRQIHVTGHSLGGAMATICAKRLSEEYENVHCLYTYGSPRVGNPKWCRSHKVSHYRFQNNNDMVCKVPFWIMGYRHHGTNVYMNYKGKVVKLRWWRRMIDSMRGRLRALFKFQLFDGIYDHDISTYANRLKDVVLDSK